MAGRIQEIGEDDDISNLETGNYYWVDKDNHGHGAPQGLPADARQDRGINITIRTTFFWAVSIVFFAHTNHLWFRMKLWEWKEWVRLN